MIAPRPPRSVVGLFFFFLGGEPAPFFHVADGPFSGRRRISSSRRRLFFSPGRGRAPRDRPPASPSFQRVKLSLASLKPSSPFPRGVRGHVPDVLSPSLPFSRQNEHSLFFSPLPGKTGHSRDPPVPMAIFSFFLREIGMFLFSQGCGASAFLAASANFRHCFSVFFSACNRDAFLPLSPNCFLIPQNEVPAS